jgi:DNA-binding transcriptional LysR family regulator
VSIIQPTLSPTEDRIAYSTGTGLTEVMDLASVPSGQVAIGMPPSVTPLILTPLMRGCLARYPAIVVRAMEGFDSAQIEEWLVNGRADLKHIVGPVRSDRPDRRVDRGHSRWRRSGRHGDEPLQASNEIAGNDPAVEAPRLEDPGWC